MTIRAPQVCALTALWAVAVGVPTEFKSSPEHIVWVWKRAKK